MTLSVSLCNDPTSQALTLTLTDITTRLLLLTHSATPSTYVQLRASQSLRGDFAAFPAYVKRLLLRVKTEQSFVAFLYMTECPQSDEGQSLEGTVRDATLRLVELSDFKAITHLELSLLAATDLQLRALLAEKARLADSVIAEANDLRTSLRVRDETIENLRQSVAALEARLAQSDRDCGEQQAKRSEVERQLDDQATAQNVIEQRDAQITSLQSELTAMSREVDRVEALNQQNTMLQKERDEAQAERLKISEHLESVKKERDAVAAEIRRGNSLIEKLQNEVRSQRAKARVKASLISRQEVSLKDMETAKATLERDLRRARDRAAFLEVEKEGLNGRLEAALAKVEENKAICESDRRVIAYLNRELNERVMGEVGRSGSASGGGGQAMREVRSGQDVGAAAS